MTVRLFATRNWTAHAVLSALAMVTLVTTGCSVLPKPTPLPLDRYTLDVRIEHTSAPTAAGPVLLVARPLARSDLDTPRMAYRKQDYDIRYFARSRWADAPAMLMLPGLVEALEGSGRFSAVVRSGSAVTPDLRLDTEVLEFSQDFRVSPSEFHIRLRVQLVDLGGRSVIASRIFEARRVASAETPYAGVQAANAAWQELLPELVAFSIARLAPAATP